MKQFSTGREFNSVEGELFRGHWPHCLHWLPGLWLMAVLRWSRGLAVHPQFCMMQQSKLSLWIVISIEALENRKFACTVTDDAW